MSNGNTGQTLVSNTFSFVRGNETSNATAKTETRFDTIEEFYFIKRLQVLTCYSPQGTLPCNVLRMRLHSACFHFILISYHCLLISFLHNPPPLTPGFFFVYPSFCMWWMLPRLCYMLLFVYSQLCVSILLKGA